jgi:hypothetical protein
MPLECTDYHVATHTWTARSWFHKDDLSDLVLLFVFPELPLKVIAQPSSFWLKLQCIFNQSIRNSEKYIVVPKKTQQKALLRAILIKFSQDVTVNYSGERQLLVQNGALATLTDNYRVLFLLHLTTLSQLHRLYSVTACSEFDSGQVTCDGHKLDFRLSIRFMCKERGLS